MKEAPVNASKALISVITPVYNGERFIESCISVVIDQGCPDVEHIVIDGGSTDATVEVIKGYAETYPHIRWISEKDEGQSDPLSKGRRMAKGIIEGATEVNDGRLAPSNRSRYFTSGPSVFPTPEE